MVERRKHKRYSMPRGTFAILRNESDPLRNHAKMSIAEIAMVLYKCEPDVMGQVRDLSAGGIAFGGNAMNLPDRGEIQLDLLLTEQGLYLHNIPYAAIPIGSDGNGGKREHACRTNALRFTHLDAEKKGQLQKLLSHHVG